jgi:hypothetical protein
MKNTHEKIQSYEITCFILQAFVCASNLSSTCGKAIEYEGINLKKTMSNDSWDEQMKDNMSDLKISHYTYTLKTKVFLIFDRWSPKLRPDEPVGILILQLE